MGLERLRRSTDHELIPFIVVSDDENESLVNEFGYKYTRKPNQPFGLKKNMGVDISLEIDYDYLMEMNSDGLIANSLMEKYKPYFQNQASFFGVRTLHFLDARNKKAKRFQYANTDIIGGARCYRRDMVEDMVKNGGFWNNGLKSGLDLNSLHNCQKRGWFHKQVDPGNEVGLIDVKSDVNIWPYEHFSLVPDVDINNVLMAISKEEKEYFLTL